MITVLVADDEAPAREELSFLLRSDDRIGDIHLAASGAEAIRILSSTAVDAAFLDIHMPGLSGFDLARALSRFEKRPALVFVTADEDRALEAFDVEAVDYVLKPVRRERLERAITRLTEATRESETIDHTRDLIAVTLGSTTRMIRRSDVRFGQAAGDYVRLHTDDGSYLVRVPLSELETQWADLGFVRVHRSYLVSLPAIAKMRLGADSPLVTVSLGDTAVDVPVSRRMLPALRERVTQTRPRAGS